MRTEQIRTVHHVSIRADGQVTVWFWEGGAALLGSSGWTQSGPLTDSRNAQACHCDRADRSAAPSPLGRSRRPSANGGSGCSSSKRADEPGGDNGLSDVRSPAPVAFLHGHHRSYVVTIVVSLTNG